MQCMISHENPLPGCSIGHPAGHMHDKRRLSAGGGHNIECKCSHTGRHESYDAALREWCQMQGVAVPTATKPTASKTPLAPLKLAEVAVERGIITTLNTMQREAMKRARAGNFELADAIELLSKGRMRAGHHHAGGWHEHDLLFGIWIGGRLQAFAHGRPLNCCGDDCGFSLDCDCGDDQEMETKLVIGLNEAVLFTQFDGVDIPDHYTDGRTPVWAQGVIDEYQALLAKPEQATFFSSEAA